MSRKKLVMKFGGTSVANLERIRRVAEKVKIEHENGYDIAVVVSAMSGVTNQLVGYVDQLHPLYDPAEYDAVVSTGELVTAGLTALALQNLGCDARSFSAAQIPIITSDYHSKARIKDIPSDTLEASFKEGKITVIAGFQGISEATGRITTLGRGGSDTSAVAIAAAIGAERCDIYTDVDGVYTTDPRIASDARKIPNISYEEMLEYASLGAKVLQTRSVELAMAHNVPVQVLSSLTDHVGSDHPGTLVCREEEIMEQQLVTGIAYAKDETKISVINVADTPGIASDVFVPLADAGVNVDMIVQNVSANGRTTHMTFTVSGREKALAIQALEGHKDKIQFERIDTDDNVTKVSAIGVGMRSHAGIAAKMFRTLAERGINIHVIATSEIKVSVLISAEYTELAVRALHSAFGLAAEK
ncbi:MAG: aspartate kinase [Pseudomonadota bacterium]